MGTPDLGKIYPALFKDMTLLDHPGAAATPFGPIPGIFLKGSAAIKLLKPLTNVVLELFQHGTGPIAGIHWGTIVGTGGAGNWRSSHKHSITLNDRKNHPVLHLLLRGDLGRNKASPWVWHLPDRQARFRSLSNLP